MTGAEVRKVVTVVFADVVGSTAIGEALDPEATRALMARWFAVAEGVIARHGGTVEKFVGDAILAVFGVPNVHEDDALRAVRAATEMRQALAKLNQALAAELGVGFEVRTGINTGEVIAGDSARGQAFVTGDAVNVAARLERAAAPGEILIGDATWRVVRDAVRLTRRRTFRAKGKARPVGAYPLTEVSAVPSQRTDRLLAPFVGRRRELARLLSAFEEAAAEKRCVLVTIVGEAGVGKSRLLAEFLASLNDRARVVRGRCLPYGEGITWWPLAEVLRREADIADLDDQGVARDKVRALVGSGGSIIADRLCAAIGLSSENAPQAEIFWAVRRLLEGLAAARPVVAIFEDVHWAEPAFLDAVEHIATLSRGVPILLLCPARPELVERRSDWGAGNLGASRILLTPLPLEDAQQLIEAMPGGNGLPSALSARIAATADGNPLFVQEMVGMLLDEGVLRETGEGWAVDEGRADQVKVPPNIQALLATRLDQLLSEERAVAGRASVVGRVFEEAAVLELAPELLRPVVPAALVALVRKELIVPDRAELTVGDAFKFRHVLIRDAAYGALPKAERAELHERFGAWLEQAVGDRAPEYEEILGYHFEQAHGYRLGLGLRDASTAALARRAGRWLARAGERARRREDAGAARRLLWRATALLTSEDEEYQPARLRLASAMLSQTDYAAAIAIFDEVVAATQQSRPELAGEARCLRLEAVQSIRPVALEDVRRELASILRSLHHHPASVTMRSNAWRIAGEVIQDLGDMPAAERAYRRALRHAEAAGDEAARFDALLCLTGLGARGEMPVAEAERLALDIVARTAARPAQRAWCLLTLAFLCAAAGRFEEAREHVAESFRIREDLGIASVHTGVTAGLVELLAGDLNAAERHFRTVRSLFERLGVTSEGPFIAARLAQVLALQGKNDESLQLADYALEQGRDPYARGLGAGTRARVLARLSRTDEARRLVEENVAWAREQQLNRVPLLFGALLEDLAAVLALAGDRVGAEAALREAIERYERKGSPAAADRARERYEAQLATVASHRRPGAGAPP
jgi:class 3 adenylate cyclase/tetratricopeptide (TPR) repeat protein